MATKLFVGNLSYRTTRNRLIDLFEQTGTVTSCEMAFDGRTNTPLGYAIVEMATPEDLANAIAQMRFKEVDGRLIVVKALKDHQAALPTI